MSERQVAALHASAIAMQLSRGVDRTTRAMDRPLRRFPQMCLLVGDRGIRGTAVPARRWDHRAGRSWSPLSLSEVSDVPDPRFPLLVTQSHTRGCLPPPSTSLVVTRLLFPFCDAVVIFAEDVGGLDGVRAMLSAWSAVPDTTPFPETPRPHVTVFTHPSTTRPRDLSSFHEFVRSIESGAPFDPNIVLHLDSPRGHVRDGLLQNVLARELAQARERRAAAHMLFTATDLRWFFACAASQLSLTSARRLDFIAASRIARPLSSSFATCLGHFFRLAVRHDLPRKRVVEYVSSRIALDAWQVGEHAFSPAAVYESCYAAPVALALERDLVPPWELASLPPPSVYRERLGEDIKRKVCVLLGAGHRGGVQRSHQHLLPAAVRHKMQSSSFCLCLRQLAEHPFRCQHSICELCISERGRPMRGREYTYRITCPSCNCTEPIIVSLKPPTASARVLTVDAGGIRGVVALESLNALSSRFAEGSEIREYFDLAIGSSSGGLIVLAYFLEGWSLRECNDRFDTYAARVFGTSRSTVTSLLSLPFLRWLVTDDLYDTDVVAETLRENFGPSGRLFRCSPDGRTRCKVAVTSTNARALRVAGQCSLDLWTTYNGPTPYASGNAPQHWSTARYMLECPQHGADSVPVWKTAQATSAVPLAFHPVRLLGAERLDGALEASNPTLLGQLEAERLWPCQKGADVILSLGTGRVAPPKASNGLRWSVSDLYHWGMHKTDTETVHREMQARHGHEAGIYHRIDVEFVRQPSIDEVDRMPELRDMVRAADLADSRCGDRAAFSLLATSFFVELKSMPLEEGSQFDCVATVMLRGDCEQVLGDLRAFCRGAAVPRIVITGSRPAEQEVSRKSVCQHCHRFRLPIRFSVGSLDEEISVSLVLREIDAARDVSSFPQTLNALMRQQGLLGPQPERKLTAPYKCRWCCAAVESLRMGSRKRARGSNDNVLDRPPRKRRAQACQLFEDSGQGAWALSA